MTKQTLCPCESGLPFATCCGPLLAGDQQAATAEALMRSRYTAYTRAAMAYLLDTWHATTRPESIDIDAIPHWCGLEIISCEQGQAEDSEGWVEFRATALAQERLIVLRERSRFVREDGQWLYVDGEFIEEEQPTVSAEPAVKRKKVGRNDPCPCGSGKKFKKCCGS
nr:YchJ family metal-binding protein [uncultured Desulfobulbus sp.]